MTEGQLRKTLFDSITEDEWIRLEQNAKALPVGEFNRHVLLRMRDNQCGTYGDVPDERVSRLYILLKGYLEKYMPECPEGHKWIIIACIYLTFIEKLPMHPQAVTGWVERDQAFLCPAHSGQGSICEYCVCEKYHK